MSFFKVFCFSFLCFTLSLNGIIGAEESPSGRRTPTDVFVEPIDLDNNLDTVERCRKPEATRVSDGKKMPAIFPLQEDGPKNSTLDTPNLKNPISTDDDITIQAGTHDHLRTKSTENKWLGKGGAFSPFKGSVGKKKKHFGSVLNDEIPDQTDAENTSGEQRNGLNRNLGSRKQGTPAAIATQTPPPVKSTNQQPDNLPINTKKPKLTIDTSTETPTQTPADPPPTPRSSAKKSQQDQDYEAYHNIRPTLILLQYILLITAFIVFVAVILYSIYYIRLIKEIYDKKEFVVE